MYQKLLKALSSRTVWTICGLFIFNGLVAIQGSVPEELQVGVNAVLSILAAFYKVNPSQKY
jgi:hypothetical protein